jgi:hypothetical protein
VLCLPSQVVVARIHRCDLTAVVTSSHPTDEEGNKSNALTHAAATVAAAEAARNHERRLAHHHNPRVPSGVGVRADHAVLRPATNRAAILLIETDSKSLIGPNHVLNIAFNILAGGKRIEHLELRRNDEVYLDALGAERIPDPTTAGDFCRRFSCEADVLTLMNAINESRLRVWAQQPDEFLDSWDERPPSIERGVMHEGKQIGIVERGSRARVVEGTSHARVCYLMLCTIII